MRAGDRVAWSGMVDGRAALEAIWLPGTEDGVVVFSWSDRPPGVETWHPYENVSRVRADGSIAWTAPRLHDEWSYTGVRWDDGKLIGHLWANSAELDPETGGIVRSWFTK